MKRNIEFNLEKLTDFIENYSNLNGYPPSYRDERFFKTAIHFHNKLLS